MKFIFGINKCLIITVFLYIVSSTLAQITSFRSDFTKGSTGDLPEGWTLNAYWPERAPHFLLRGEGEDRYLSLSGCGDPTAVAYIATKVILAPGTYHYKALFSISDDVNPQRNLLFQCKTKTLDGIFRFYRLGNGMVEGRETIVVTGDQPCEAEIRIFYRFHAAGEVKLKEISITPTEPVQPRWVRFACTKGKIKDFDQMRSVAEQASKDNTDLLLFSETVTQFDNDASQGEAILNLLSELAAHYRMFVAASVWIIDKTDNRKYNRGVLNDRNGELVGTYDKIHPYSPEVNEGGITPGVKTDVFDTELGRLGMIICYDSWFTDVTQLLALKGAEVILFPVAGCYRSLLHARAADNQVRFVCSIWNNYGIFDTAGRDVQQPDIDPSVNTSGDTTFKDVRTFEVNDIGLLCASLDLNCNISPHYNGGTMNEAPGGKRNRDEQLLYLDDLIKKEKERWWVE